MATDDVKWRPFHEPLLITLARNGTIALVAGLALAPRFGGLAHWPATALMMLWPSFGGHCVEVWFLNYLRPRLPVASAAQATARLAVWFIGGAILFLGVRLTAMALGGVQLARWPAWWLGGFIFVAIELGVHLVLQLLGRPGFFNQRG